MSEYVESVECACGVTCDPRDPVSHRAECGAQFGQHPSMPNLVAVCTLPSGHEGDHGNVLPKTLASLLGAATRPGAPTEGGA